MKQNAHTLTTHSTYYDQWQEFECGACRVDFDTGESEVGECDEMIKRGICPNCRAKGEVRKELFDYPLDGDPVEWSEVG